MNSLQVHFGNKQVLKNVNLTINRGSTVTLLGLSGCGKSTLMRCLLGLVKPTRGDIFWNDTRLNNRNIFQFREQVGYVPQDGGLFPHLSIRDNILIGSHQQSRKIEDLTKRLNELANLCQIPKSLLSHRPHQLSGGQKQRASLMRALFNDPEILILDEPFSALDPIIRGELQDYILQLKNNLKKTMLLVTHDMFEAHLLSDSISIMNEGNIVQTGLIDDFLENPQNEFVRKLASTYRKRFLESSQK